MKNNITIIRNQGTENQRQTDVATTSFVLLYLDSGKVRVDGDIELRDIAPMLMKYVAERMTK